MMTDASFYIIAREPGAENPVIPTWACDWQNPARIDAEESRNIERIEVPDIPGAFQLLDVLSEQECERICQITEKLGYLEDAAVSLPRSIRHNHSLTWVVDDQTSELIWQRCCDDVVNEATRHCFFGKKPLGLNNRFRFYRYQPGDYFKPHTDGSWPGSRVINGQLVQNAFDDRWSQLTFLLFLTDDYEGGSTRFMVGDDIVDIRTSQGGVLCFPHGTHPLHCLHSSEPITSGVKYIMRSDVLFEI